ncbi:MAG: PH domain-containing protein [Candidatus Dormibacteria bacterium]
MTLDALPATPVLRPPLHLVSPSAIWYWTLRALLGWLVLLLVELIWELSDSQGSGWHLLALVATVVVAAAHLVVMPRWRFRVHRWEVTPVAVYTQAGWFHQERRLAPLSRIQTVDSEQGPLEQILGLARVTTNTASAAGALRISGLALEDAQRLALQLTTMAQRTPGDAT